MPIINTVISGGGSAPAHYIEKTVDANGKLINSTNIINLNGATDVGNYVLYYSYYNNSAISGAVDMSYLTTISGDNACQYMFSGCTGITSVDLSGLVTISGFRACQSMFQSCTDITSVDLSSLTTLSGSNACNSMFYGCAGITSLDLSGLTAVSGDSACVNMFSGCTDLTSVDLSGLTTISGDNACQYMFSGCTDLTSVDLSGLTTVGGDNACQYMFSGCTGITSVDLSGLTTVSGNSSCYNMFSGCTGITSLDLSNITTLSGSNACNSMFSDCTGITSVDLSGLTTISGDNVCQYMFSDCTDLTSVDLSGLTTVSGNYACQRMFQGCGLTSVYLKSLKRIESSSTRTLALSQMFGNCPVVDLRNLQYVGNYTIDSLCYTNNTLSSINLNSLEHIGTEGARTLFYLTTPSSSLSNIYLPMLTSFGNNPFYSNAFTGRTNLTIHFRKDAQATVEALQNYATLWGAGTGSSVVFDLAGTLTGADSNSYARSEKDSVYASETAGSAKTATAWSYNDAIYYTSGGAEPQVGDTIYSDSACTTAVTTISSIA